MEKKTKSLKVFRTAIDMQRHVIERKGVIRLKGTARLSHLTVSFLVLCLLLTAVTGCAHPKEATPEEMAPETKIIKIGVLAPLTGTVAADGEEMVRGASLAAKEINEAGGILGYTFEIVTGDTKDQVPDAVISAFEKITADEAVGCMMTGYASTTNFEIEYMARINMPYIISANGNQTRDIIAKDPDAFPTVWSIVPAYDAYETELPRVVEQWAKEGKIKLTNRKVAIITSDNPYSRAISEGLKTSFPEYGWTVTVDEMVPLQDIHDWRSIISKIQMDPPDLIVNTDYLPANAGSFMNQLMENPTKSLVFIQYAPSVPEFVELTKEKSTGILYNMLGGMIRSPKMVETGEFIDKFKDEYGVETGEYGYALYVSVYLYAEALKKVGDPNDRLAIGKAIGETDKMTARGRLVFDPDTHLAIQGDDYVPILFYQIWEAERVLVYPPQYATGEFRLPPWMK